MALAAVDTAVAAHPSLCTDHPQIVTLCTEAHARVAALATDAIRDAKAIASGSPSGPSGDIAHFEAVIARAAAHAARLQIDSDAPLSEWSHSTVQWWLSSNDRLKLCLPALAGWDGRDLCQARQYNRYPAQLTDSAVAVNRLLAEMAAVEARLASAPPKLALVYSRTAEQCDDLWKQKWSDAAAFLPH